MTGVQTCVFRSLTPTLAPAQTAPPSFAEFAARCRALAGFDVLPRALIDGLDTHLSPDDRAAVVAQDGGDVDKQVLKALYTGVLGHGGEAPERIGYSDALMYAAVEETLNVPSYCGGVPAFWAEKPEVHES